MKDERCRKCKAFIERKPLVVELRVSRGGVVTGYVTDILACSVCGHPFKDKTHEFEADLSGAFIGHRCGKQPPLPRFQAGLVNLIPNDPGPERMLMPAYESCRVIATCSKHKEALIQKDMERGGCPDCIREAREDDLVFREFLKLPLDLPLSVEVTQVLAPRGSFSVRYWVRCECAQADTGGRFDATKTF